MHHSTEDERKNSKDGLSKKYNFFKASTALHVKIQLTKLQDNIVDTFKILTILRPGLPSHFMSRSRIKSYPEM